MSKHFKKQYESLQYRLIMLIKRWDIWESVHLDGIEEMAVKKCRLEVEEILKDELYGGTSLRRE